MAQIFKRKLYADMLKWKETRHGSTALLIKGARRTGKSTIAETFAKNEYKSYILIDFSIAGKNTTSLFEDLSDLNFLFLTLQANYHVKLYERQSVIIFDEVQLAPKARQAIKHLVKDGRYDYIETGSLLTLKRNVKDIVIPSEETRVTLNPLDYEEFLWAIGDELSMDLIKASFAAKRPLGDDVNRRLMRYFRLYMLVGGMPQAVNAYLETNNLEYVDNVKREILELYKDDFRKIDPSGKASLIFSAIPAELNKNTSRYQLSSVVNSAKTERISEILMDMADSMAVNISYHSNDPAIGLSLHRDTDKFKLFMADTGLFVTLAFMDKSYTDNVIYAKILSDKLDANLGYIYENVIAQMLVAAGYNLFYYTFAKPNDSNHHYEVDFLLTHRDKLCPLEVKSSGYKTHKSLDAFQDKYSSRISQRYLIYTKDLRKEHDIICIPAYMTPLL
jgi:hypothetical protein